MPLPHNYEMVIGLEVHAQVNTQSKLFSPAPTAFGAAPNTQAHPIDLGMPGMLPVLNKAAVEAGVKLGLAIDATVNHESVFARKNYFYPDLPKGYQTSQADKPIVSDGQLVIAFENNEGEPTEKTIRIERMHLEEDAGKSVHDRGASTESHIDLNRAGTPLMEIVSRPDLASPEEAGAYMKKMRSLLRYIGVCDGNMEEGSLRCDANVSVRKIGDETLGTRCEIKNLNSIKFVQKAIQYEAERQVALLEDGEKVIQQTRLYDAAKNETRAMRGKEDAHDYRYFPCPDLLPLRISAEDIATIQAEMPELPDAKKARFMADYGLSAYDASVITASRRSAEFYETMLEKDANDQPTRNPKLCANWMTGELFAALKATEKEIDESPIGPVYLGELVGLIESGEISGKIAKEVFADMLESGDAPSEVVEKKGLKQLSDPAQIGAMIDEIIANNAGQVEKFRGGNQNLFGFFVGQTMKASGGKANPQVVNALLKEKLS